MRAAFIRKLGNADTLEVGDLPAPTIKSTEVRVRVRFAALNQLDIWVRKGLPNLNYTFPWVLGGDASGVIEKMGDEVEGFELGQEVIIHPGVSCLKCEKCLQGWETLCSKYQILGEHRPGVNAELVSVPAANLFLKPRSISMEEAAAIPLVFSTAWQMLVKRAKIQPGDWVLIHAAGSGVSSAAIQIARLYQARTIVTAGDERKLSLAKKLGAEFAIAYRNEDFGKEVKKITGGKGVDVVVDHVGQDLWEKNLKCLKWGGTLVTCGATSGYEAKTDLRQVFYRQLSLLGSTMGSKGDFSQILRHVENGKLKAVIDKVFPLDQIRAAHEHLEKRGQFGKVVLAITP